MNIKKLLLRTFSGIIYCLIIVGCIFLGKYGVLGLSIALSIGACIEFARICHNFDERHFPTMILEIAGCVALCFSVYVYPIFIWIAIMIMRSIEELYVNSEKPLLNLSHSFMSQIYIGLPMALMTIIAYVISPMILLAIFFLIWINDTGAFIVGCSIGRHKLFERISPKKTWEGFFGGLVCCIGASALFFYFGNDFFEMNKIFANLGIWLGFGATVAIFGTWGDLIESMIKRNLKIKDSGNIIPGHGGILDRIDSLLIVIPAIFIYLLITIILRFEEIYSSVFNLF